MIAFIIMIMGFAFLVIGLRENNEVTQALAIICGIGAAIMFKLLEIQDSLELLTKGM